MTTTTTKPMSFYGLPAAVVRRKFEPGDVIACDQSGRRNASADTRRKATLVSLDLHRQGPNYMGREWHDPVPTNEPLGKRYVGFVIAIDTNDGPRLVITKRVYGLWDAVEAEAAERESRRSASADLDRQRRAAVDELKAKVLEELARRGERPIYTGYSAFAFNVPVAMMARLLDVEVPEVLA